MVVLGTIYFGVIWRVPGISLVMSEADCDFILSAGHLVSADWGMVAGAWSVNMCE